jgi:hypothetical protein
MHILESNFSRRINFRTFKTLIFQLRCVYDLKASDRGGYSFADVLNAFNYSTQDRDSQNTEKSGTITLVTLPICPSLYNLTPNQKVRAILTEVD